ncbi:MAG: DNA repair protein RecO [Candidatus Omnitrophica bacterium]|nr:DNA repair protein RecO [Candidatus Omnitrophota bacterium]MDE2010173.1 DNA repair protein RecO [Candidatus Omnitrophota bacterium]MDE2214907.1 DNA repair protein RecO [Candidatus Omnitrophota bacterium]MDE2230763.1 DNA repair protein RecO [Candidatus Omnitrophota bacterium]
MILKTEAIVLKSFDFRETSRIAVFFTRDFGKVKGLLKGIRKDPRKFGSSVEKFSLNDIVYYQYRNSEIHLVGQCDMKDFFTGLRGDLARMTAASYASELIDTLMPAEEKNAEIYHLMRAFLKSLQTVKDVGKLVHTFQIKVLSLSGFKPHLESCVSCNKEVEHSPRFSLRLGGLLCGACADCAGEARPISSGAVASIMHIQKNDWEKAERLGMAPFIKNELKYVLEHFLVFHLERHLRSTRFLT